MRTIFIVLFALVFAPLSAETVKEETRCQVYFSPDDHVADHLIDLIHKEEKSIEIAAYAFSHSRIATALIDAKKRGVLVEVVVDPFSLKFSSLLNRMVKVGIPVWVWKHEQNQEKYPPIMHDKFCLFGGKSIWTGSFNFTYHADTMNRENAIYIQDKALAKKFHKQFEKIKSGAAVYQQK
jgi:phosphatidylserine/phosphatidylglycerophosphate/cardiolipin synthase-like enzyme